jgi:hypothetical protein
MVVKSGPIAKIAIEFTYVPESDTVDITFAGR